MKTFLSTCWCTIFLMMTFGSVAGCSIKTLGETEVLITRADERIIFAHHLKHDRKDNGKQAQRIICAEPSPDVARAVQKSLGLSSELEGEHPPSQMSAGLAASFANARAETIAQLGERLATIQLLRDGLYRACEAYANGVLSKPGYAVLLSRFDDTMITLLFGELAAGNFGRSLVKLTGSAGSSALVDKPTIDALGQLLESTEVLENQRIAIEGKKELLNELEQAGETNKTADLRKEVAKLETEMKEENARLADAAEALAPVEELIGSAEKVAGATDSANKKTQELEKVKMTNDPGLIADKQEELDEAQKEVKKESEPLRRKARAIAKTSAEGGGELNRQPTGEIAHILNAMQRSYLFDVNSDAIAVACIVEMTNVEKGEESPLMKWCSAENGAMSTMLAVGSRILKHKVGLRGNGTSYKDRLLNDLFQKEPLNKELWDKFIFANEFSLIPQPKVEAK